MATIAYAAQGRGRGKLQCFGCKGYRHIVRNCLQKVSNYCKQPRHIIKDCPTRPPHRRTQAFQVVAQDPNPALSQASSSQHVLTLEIVHHMIVFAFSALGLQGKGQNISSHWFVDSEASNHMTGSSNSLHNIQQYIGT